MDSGDLATWVGSSLAGVAAAATLWTLKSQRDQIDEQRTFIGEQSANLTLERQALLAAAQERREAQARRIRFEVTPPYVKVLNRSEDPITEVRCREDGQPPVRAAASRADGVEASISMMLEQLQGQEQEHIDVLGVNRLGWFQRRPGLTGAVEIAFTDANDVRWTRDSQGKLTEFPPPSVP